ncbi:hypothetical protein [Phytohabitans aurantiacus]|nr:hypothetical protein [Phytohabitans aurantiacus]
MSEVGGAAAPGLSDAPTKSLRGARSKRRPLAPPDRANQEAQ